MDGAASQGRGGRFFRGMNGSLSGRNARWAGGDAPASEDDLDVGLVLRWRILGAALRRRRAVGAAGCHGEPIARSSVAPGAPEPAVVSPFDLRTVG